MTRRSFAALACLALLTGCAVSGTKVSQEQVAQFQVGQTTKADIIAQLGPPTDSTIASDGTSSVEYRYTQAQVTPETLIPYVGLLAGGAETETTYVRFHFDTEGILDSYESSQGGFDTGTGLITGQQQ